MLSCKHSGSISSLPAILKGTRNLVEFSENGKPARMEMQVNIRSAV